MLPENPEDIMIPHEHDIPIPGHKQCSNMIELLGKRFKCTRSYIHSKQRNGIVYFRRCGDCIQERVITDTGYEEGVYTWTMRIATHGDPDRFQPWPSGS